MAIEPAVKLTVSKDCETLLVEDQSVYSNGSDPLRVSQRNLVLKDPCGNRLLEAGTPEIRCLNYLPQVRYGYDLSSPGGDVVSLDSLLVDGANILPAPIVAASAGDLADVVLQLNILFDTALPQATASLDGTTITISVYSVALSTASFSVDPGGPLIPFVSTPAATFGLAGPTDTLSLVLDRAYSVSVSASSLVQPGSTLSIEAARRATQQNVQLLFASVLTEDVLADILCETGATVSFGDCVSDGCMLRITAKEGMSATNYAWSSLDPLATTDTQQQAPSGNWPLTKKFVYTPSLLVGTSVTALEVDGVSIPVSFTAAAATEDVRLANLAATLSGLGFGAFSANTTEKTIEAITSEYSYGSLTVNAVPELPEIISQADAPLEIKIECDGVYKHELCIAEDAIQYAVVVAQVPPVSAFDIQLLRSGTPYFAPQPFDLSGLTQTQQAEVAVAHLNEVLPLFLGSTPYEFFVDSFGTTLFIRASLGFIGNGSDLACGDANVEVTVSYDDGGPQAVTTSSDTNPCESFGEAVYCCCSATAVLCRTDCLYQEKLLASLQKNRTSADLLYEALRLKGLMDAFLVLVACDQLDEAQSIMRRIAQQFKIPLCTNGTPNQKTELPGCGC